MSVDSTEDEEALLAEEFARPFIERERLKRLAELRTKQFEDEANATWRAEAAQEPVDIHLRRNRSMGRHVIAEENLASQLRKVEDFGEMLRSENLLAPEGRQGEKSRNAAGCTLPSSERFMLSHERAMEGQRSPNYPDFWQTILGATSFAAPPREPSFSAPLVPACSTKDANVNGHVSTHDPALLPPGAMLAPRIHVQPATSAEVSHAGLKSPVFSGSFSRSCDSRSFSRSFDSSVSSSGSTARHARQIFAEDRAVFLEEQCRMSNYDGTKSSEMIASRPDLQLHRISEVSTIATSAAGSSRKGSALMSVQSVSTLDCACTPRQEPLPAHRISQAPSLEPFVASSASTHRFAQGLRAQDYARASGAGQVPLRRFAPPPPTPAPSAVNLQHVQR